ncbi:hypothetical protein Cycma_2680 [Cyclobacterium marinum DSM 745]|uniref:Uncharacterized protein n=1 Tax=Cyclobacterium marinum (strain ATCC 25205 / DSM 745 / LMG 13164 / NCIMB 1802) TaxID=880070 RepID=G0IYJ6_CYCMS|nr:hypothetical protein Cycma_2680 [Cyclobacterium marinum DSM 745]
MLTQYIYSSYMELLNSINTKAVIIPKYITPHYSATKVSLAFFIEANPTLILKRRKIRKRNKSLKFILFRIFY